jgi:hypothetical protein
MIKYHLTVNVESRPTNDTLDDTVECLEQLVEHIKGLRPMPGDHITDTLLVGRSEVCFDLIHLIPKESY